ncbi:hypothetical protein SAMN04490207_1515 [Pseudomonas gessardii]|uniref:hypothetical protein n=1 Tax=Pseudomonas gessardii TaxID=78544 RepID=UPI000882ADA7|nr:hypothetical protein [Pseudomonas gessardii]MRU52240.1 hypothetical protein [Pseudomonas gessardii]ONH40086.1 hypothetical protein BLL38_17775 [Pseudomonas gessardii]SDQ69507.1 hypothetical protein SAMN04490207_1515 [Pseudomonas gessardii]
MVKKTTPQRSPSAAVGPDAEVAVELPVPQIHYAINNNTLDPIKARDGTAATIAFAGMGTTPITVYWAIKDQDEPVFEPIAYPGSTSGSIDIPIPWQWVSTSIGHTVLVWYTARVAGQLKKSLVLELEVQQIREEDLKESLPVFEHAKYVQSTWKLDMKTFRGDEIIRLKAWPMIQAGQRLFINVAGDQHKPPFAFSWVARDHVVTEAEAHEGHVFEFKLSRSWMARREDYSALTLHIAVIFDGTAPKPPVPVDPIYETQLPENAHEFHPRTTVLLLVDKSLHLPAPTLVEAEGSGQVDPLKLLEGATVRVCYDDMQSTDLITLRWESTFGDDAPIAPQYGVEDGCVDFHVPPLYVGMRLDNFALFSYTVTREDEVFASLEGVVRIPLPSNLPAPQVLQAYDKTLDLSRLCCKDPILYVAPWAFIDPTQRVDVYIGGTYADGSKARWNFFTDSPVTEEDVRNGWSRALPREELAKLKHDSELYIVFYVEFLPRKTGRPVYRMFPSLLLTLQTEPHLELTAPHLVESVDDGTHGWVVNPINTVEGAHLQVAYEHMCPGDRVCPTFSGTPGPGSPALECRPVEDEASLEFWVPPSAISANFNQPILLAYRVMRCDGSEWQSPAREVEVLGLSGLPTPRVEQSTGNVLDLNTFSGDATALVVVWDYMALGQACWLWVTGEQEDGSPYRFEVLEGEPVTEEWLDSGVSAQLPRLALQALADCSDFQVHFAVNFNGELDRGSAKTFPVLSLEVVQEDWVLTAPTVREAVGSQLTVYNGREGVTVRVAYERMSASHGISVCWKRSDGTCLPLMSKPGNNDPQYVDFHIPREAVIHGSGKTVKIHYTVTSLCKVATSADLDLQISVPVRLPTPVVPQATNGILDLRTFTGDADIRVEPWWFILPGQKVWLRGIGTRKDGSPYLFNIYLGKEVTAGEVTAGLRQALKRIELELLKNFSTLTFTCKVTADGSNQESAAVVFPALILSVRMEPEIRYENFTGQPNRKISAGQSVDIATMTITLLPGSGGTSGIEFYAWTTPGMLDGPALVVCSNSSNQVPEQRIRVDFKLASQRVKFAYTWQQHPVDIVFYDKTGRSIGSRYLPPAPSDNDQQNHWIDFTAPADSSITSMIVRASDHAYIDFFTFWGA